MLMAIMILATLLAGLLLPGVLYLFGRRHVLDSIKNINSSHLKPLESDSKADSHSKATVIIPVTGNPNSLILPLKSLMTQDYPNYEIIFVTRDMEDPAVTALQELLTDTDNVRHITSGPAACCGQKNHNLLAGIASADPSTEIFVFCDSTHIALPDFLSSLIHPILTGTAEMTSGFHQIEACDSRPATVGMAINVLGIHLLQGVPRFSQPWGGAMAIRKETFERHKIGELWAETVVDDFSMGPFLQKRKVKCHPVARACLSTPLQNQTLGDWNLWLTRQLLYMKFYTPGYWLAAAPGVLMLIFPVFIATMVLIFSLAEACSSAMGLAAAVFFVLFSGIGVRYQHLLLKPVPRVRWLMAFYMLLFMMFWCYLKTWFTNRLDWKGISYQVAWGGKVKRIFTDV